MTVEQSRLTQELNPAQVESMGTSFVDFAALSSVPTDLGYAAHRRLEDILARPIASDDADYATPNNKLGQKIGERLGDLVGREREFTRNVPVIDTHVDEIAAMQGVQPSSMWDQITEVLIGSGIGAPMHRTLDRPVGGSYGARSFIDERSSEGIVIIHRANIANWGARRQDVLLGLIGSMSLEAQSRITHVIHAGTERQYAGAELWRPEVRPYVNEDENGEEVCSLTEATAARLLFAPSTRALLDNNGMSDRVAVETVELEGAKTSGDDVVRRIAREHSSVLNSRLIIEVGNAPAGYTQLAAGLVLAEELGIDPAQQFLAVTDSVEIVHPDHFAALGPEGRSKVQNAKTALNSFNGWLQAIVRVNKFAAAQ